MRFRLITDLQHSPAEMEERGLHYGDGIFETMLLRDGSLLYWHQHYDRLHRSACKLRIDCPTRDWFELHLRPYVALKQTLIIKIILTRGSGGRGLDIPDELMPSVFLLHYLHAKGAVNQSISAFISEVFLPRDRQLAGIKHLNRLHYVLATQDLKQHPGYNEALLCDGDGVVIESIVHNLFFVKDARIHSPDLSECGVDGIMRGLIIKKLEQWGQQVTIGRYTKQHVAGASECFLCNSVQGIRPVVRLEQVEFEVGPLTSQLQQEFHGPKAH